MNIFGKWIGRCGYENPFVLLSKGHQCLHYTFRKDCLLTAKEMKQILFLKGFQYPIFYRINKICDIKYLEFMTTNPNLRKFKERSI